jgi:hypothetical protein
MKPATRSPNCAEASLFALGTDSLKRPDSGTIGGSYYCPLTLPASGCLFHHAGIKRLSRLVSSPEASGGNRFSICLISFCLARRTKRRRHSPNFRSIWSRLRCERAGEMSDGCAVYYVALAAGR